MLQLLLLHHLQASTACGQQCMQRQQQRPRALGVWLCSQTQRQPIAFSKCAMRKLARLPGEMHQAQQRQQQAAAQPSRGQRPAQRLQQRQVNKQAATGAHLHSRNSRRSRRACLLKRPTCWQSCSSSISACSSSRQRGLTLTGTLHPAPPSCLPWPHQLRGGEVAAAPARCAVQPRVRAATTALQPRAPCAQRLLLQRHSSGVLALAVQSWRQCMAPQQAVEGPALAAPAAVMSGQPRHVHSSNNSS